MKTLEQLYSNEYDTHLYGDVLPEETPVEKAFAQNQPTVQAMPQSNIEKVLEQSGIKLDQAAQFLEGLGSVNVGGIDFTLRDLLPVDRGTSEALKTAGSGMPLTTGSGILNTKFKPEFTEAGKEIALATVAAKPIAKGISAMTKAAMKNKGKVITGATVATGTSATKEKAK
jgi:hypothetical protein